ncbi:Na(+)/H(+) exchange regulatory cofactor NHE-RF2-like [Daphnia pulicaria]|uniref:Na(+)/H(+) exchange regulatory cofactor NHE-RF2-like n=1 Tax=Daphnia pulicaria TaxID=35523 RepID=UPI001EEA7182|nr:Na(+)/H(+) exchange regulatory cofactor NHE-RF2-like [Daphnia pulicaria]
MDAIPPDAPAPRLCHVIKRPDFEGFGFNLFAGKVKTGQFIGKVDAGSPAEDAGLKPGDRIIEVNGVHIGVENHKQVVQRIKLRPDETELLVVDDETDEYYASRGLTIKSTNSNVIRKRSSPAPEPARKISSSSSESESEQQKQAARLQQQQQQQAYVTNGQRRESSSSEGEDWSNAPAPRLCHVIKWNENDGFGFHLLADKKRKGQFIGKVDAGSAAEAAGLKLSDRIVEVNGHNVVEETHKQVVQRIKAVANETKLLVIDPQGQLYYAERNITITSSMPNVQKMRTPATPPQRINNRPDHLKLAVTTATAITETNGSSMAPPPKSSLKRVSSAPAPRLCHIIKWRQDAGYGFHLLADKKRVGHFIGKVDPNTPASAGGLKVGDRIIEVNGHNVVNETHKQIVERIKSVSNETKLLVLDPEADLYYRERDIMVSSSQSNVALIKTPAAPRATNESSDDDDDYEVKLRSKGSRSPPSRSSVSPLTSPTSPTRPLSMATIAAAANSGLNLNMSAAQLRARLAAQKKYDPKREAMDLRRKHEIIQTM